MEDLLGIGIRAIVIYIYCLALLRLAGKRSIGELAAIDFIVANLIGDLLDDAFWGNVPLANAFMAVGITILVHMIVSYGVFRSPNVDKTVNPQKRTMAKNGRFDENSLTKERTRRETIYSDMRIRATEHLNELKEANLEPNGELSVTRIVGEKKAQKQDLPALKKTLK